MIEVEHLAKHYNVHVREAGFLASMRSLFARQFKTVKAVDDISFQIAKGEIVGFLGPNGAGKTTTMKMLTGLLHPTAGQLTVGGYRPADQKNAFKRSISLVMGQKSQLLWDLPPSESFLINKEIYEIPDQRYRKMLDSLTELLELQPLLGKPVRQLSLGERMKCELAAALLHEPQIVFLDEPTIGLDVNMQETLRRFIRTYNQEHEATILLTSHYMADVSALCERVLVIAGGKLLYDGAISELILRHAPHKRIEITFDSLEALQAFANDSLPEGTTLLEISGQRAVLEVPRAQVSSVSSLLLGRYALSDLTIEEPSMESVISRAFTPDEEPSQLTGATP